MKKYYEISDWEEIRKLKIGDCFQLSRARKVMDVPFRKKFFKICDIGKVKKKGIDTCNHCAFFNRQKCGDIPCGGVIFKEIDYYEVLFRLGDEPDEKTL